MTKRLQIRPLIAATVALGYLMVHVGGSLAAPRSVAHRVTPKVHLAQSLPSTIIATHCR